MSQGKKSRVGYYNPLVGKDITTQSNHEKSERYYLNPGLKFEKSPINVSHHPGEGTTTKGMLVFAYIVFVFILLVGIGWLVSMFL